MKSQLALRQYLETQMSSYQALNDSLDDQLTWVSYHVLLHEEPGKTDSWIKGGDKVLDCPEFEVARIATAFANEQRVRLLKCLYEGYHTFRDLREQTEMNAGQLQHHLKELALSGFLVDISRRNHYELSKNGKALLLLMLCVGKWQPEAEGQHFLTPEQVQADD